MIVRLPAPVAVLLVTGAALLLAVPAMGAAPGPSIDSGAVAAELGGTAPPDSTVNAVVTQPDGSILVGGTFTSLAGIVSNRVARLHSDGTVDSDFSAQLGAGFDGPVTALALQPDGRILVGGTFTSLAGVPAVSLARLNPDGSPDLEFSTVFSTSVLGMDQVEVRAVTVQPDGRIVLAGAFASANSLPRLSVLRLAADGSLDATFRPPAVATTTLFGTSIYTGDGATFGDALASANATYGGLDVVRVFYSGLPAPWPGKAGLSGGPVVVSFKASPKAVVAGDLDAFFREWFAAAPRDRDIYWTNFHEPEDNIEAGAFTVAEYKEAFRRLAGLASEAGNPHLKATTIWMCWDLRPGSGRDWHDYDPGADVVDVMAWDCYNNRGTARGVYLPPTELLDDLRAASESMNKPWGLAEYGSQLAAGDDGTGRAGWLVASAAYAREHGALWVSYYDARHRADYRLTDAPSMAAWRSVVAAG